MSIHFFLEMAFDNDSGVESLGLQRRKVHLSWFHSSTHDTDQGLSTSESNIVKRTVPTDGTVPHSSVFQSITNYCLNFNISRILSNAGFG